MVVQTLSGLLPILYACVYKYIAEQVHFLNTPAYYKETVLRYFFVVNKVGELSSKCSESYLSAAASCSTFRSMEMGGETTSATPSPPFCSAGDGKGGIKGKEKRWVA